MYVCIYIYIYRCTPELANLNLFDPRHCTTSWRSMLSCRRCKRQMRLTEARAAWDNQDGVGDVFSRGFRVSTCHSPHCHVYCFCFSCSILPLLLRRLLRPHQHNININQHQPTSTNINTPWTSTRHHQHNTITTTSSTRDHQHNTINTWSSTHHHHLHNTINTTPSTLHHQHSSTRHHQHKTINTSSSTHHHLHNTINTTPSTLHLHTTPSTSSTQHHLHDITYTTRPAQHHQHIIINRTSTTRHHQHNTINTTSIQQHHQRNTIYTTSTNKTPSTQHHQHHPHKIIYTTSSTRHNQPRCSTRSTSALGAPRGPRKSGDNWLLWTPAAFAWQVQPAALACQVEYYGRRLLSCGKCSTSRTSVSFCVAGAALGGPQHFFEWQVQHLEHLSLILRGRCSFRNTFRKVRCVFVAGAAFGAPRFHFAWQVQHLEHLSPFFLRGRCSTWSTSVSFCVAAQQLEHLAFILRRRCSTWSTFREVRGSPATIEYCGRQLLLRCRCSTWRTSAFFFEWQVQHLEHLSLILRGRCSFRNTFRKVRCVFVAGAAFGAPRFHFAWQAQHLEHLSPFCVAGAALGAPRFHFAWQAQHLEHLAFILRGWCSTGSISLAYCGCGACSYFPEFHGLRLLHVSWVQTDGLVSSQTDGNTHPMNCSPNTTSSTHNIYTTSSAQHHQHNFINTSPPSQHHLHNTIYTTSSTQHYLLYIITYWQVQHLERCHLTPSASFLLIPLLLFFVVVFLCSVSLTYSTLGCPKALLTCGLSGPIIFIDLFWGHKKINYQEK